MSPSPIRLLIHGATGRMGRAVLRLAASDPRFQVVAAVSRSGDAASAPGVPCLAAMDLRSAPGFDVAVDFSLPEAMSPLIELCRARGSALVSGTTGLGNEHRVSMQGASESAAVVWASNYSLGVAVLEDLVRRAASALAKWELKIVETHHVHKKDAPSGTALTLARAASPGGRTPAIESVREGEVVGEHLVRFSGPGETLELLHRADDRDIFAAGALEAAALVAKRPPGMYRLADLLFS